MNVLWSFDDFDAADATRAAHLRDSPPWAEIVARVRAALRTALLHNAARFGFDESGRKSSDLRAVVQFPAGRGLVDWLFNGRSGYRAQFRLGSEYGARQNARLISELRGELAKSARDPITARRLNSEFEDLGSMGASRDQLLGSLDPELSKLWICEKLIGELGGIQTLFVSRTGPKLLFTDGEPWCSLYPEEGDGWLDVKGAFVSSGYCYQLKRPQERAKNLALRGTA